MACSEDKTILLSKYVDNELTAGERRQIEDHLADCDNCRELLSIFMRNESILSNALATGIYKDEIVQKVMNRIENPPEVEPAEESRWEMMSRVGREKPWIPLSAAAMILMGLVFFLRFPGNSEEKQLQDRITQLENSIQNYQKMLTDQGMSSQQESEAILSQMNQLNQELVRERLRNSAVDIPGNSTAAFFQNSGVGVTAHFDQADQYIAFDVHRSDNDGKTWFLKKAGLPQPTYEDPQVAPGKFYVYKFIAWTHEKKRVQSVPVRLQAPVQSRLDASKYIRIYCTEIGPKLNVATFAVTRRVGKKEMTYHFTVELGKELGRIVHTPHGEVDFSTGLAFNRVEMGDQTMKVTFAWPKFDPESGAPIWRTAGQQDYELRDQILSIRENRRAVLDTYKGESLKVWRGEKILIPLP